MDREYHGWSRQQVEGGPPVGPTLFIMKHPARKSVALASDDGHSVRVLAYFRNPEDAQFTLQSLDFIILGEPVEPEYPQR